MALTHPTTTNAAKTMEETILIDEKELISKFVDKAQGINKILIAGMNRKMMEYGLDPSQYVGGLSCTICSTDMSLEQNINNLFAVYSANYAESIFFQCENIKLMNTMNVIHEYLIDRGLEYDFLKFKESKEANKIKQGQIKTIEQSPEN